MDTRRTWTVGLVAILLMAAATTGRAATITLFSDGFNTPGADAGANWSPYSSGYPDTVSARITDSGRGVYRMRSENASAFTYGVITASNVAIPLGSTDLIVDANVAPREGGNTSIGLQVVGSGGNVRLLTQDFFPRRVLTDGGGSGGGFGDTSGSNIYSNFTFYHFVLEFDATGTTISLKSDDLTSTLYTYTTANLKLADLGSSFDIRLFQSSGAGTVESFVDSVTVTALTVPTPAALPAGLALASLVAMRRRR